MESRPRRVWLRPARLATGRLIAGRNQARPRRGLDVPRAVVLLPMVVGAVLLLALRPSEITRATPPSTWAPLPEAAFSALPSPWPSATPSALVGSADSSEAPAPPLGRLRPRGGTAADSIPAGGGAGAAVVVRSTESDDVFLRAAVQAAPAPAPTPNPAPKGPTHVVATGDNLWTIARRHSAVLASILRWNEGVDPDRLVAGQRILVPGGSKMVPLAKPSLKPNPVEPGTASVRPAAVERQAAANAEDGDHLWPLPVRGDLTRRFSAAHPGIDIAAPRGTPVRAIADGTVVWAGWKDNGGGYVVEVRHPDGMRSIYNHNSVLTVEDGDRVAQGDTIALVGSTGNSTGPHLDLRIMMGGRLVDPLRLL